MDRARKGLTLIELLIIVVMIGILLTITYTKFSGGPGKEILQSLKDDITTVRKAESDYFAQHNAYGSRAQLDSVKVITPGIGNVLTITATATGYTALVKNETEAGHPRRCSVDMSGGESTASKVDMLCTN
ncbi:MAG: prepilin-type N-terminal cleavage/methylation domain-containing protein [Gemmatimonadota bacterium]